MKTKDLKREEAQARARDRATLTPAQQLAKLDAEGHNATKERARLVRLIEKEQVQ